MFCTFLCTLYTYFLEFAHCSAHCLLDFANFSVYRKSYFKVLHIFLITVNLFFSILYLYMHTVKLFLFLLWLILCPACHLDPEPTAYFYIYPGLVSEYLSGDGPWTLLCPICHLHPEPTAYFYIYPVGWSVEFFFDRTE